MTNQLEDAMETNIEKNQQKGAMEMGSIIKIKAKTIKNQNNFMCSRCSFYDLTALKNRNKTRITSLYFSLISSLSLFFLLSLSVKPSDAQMEKEKEKKKDKEKVQEQETSAQKEARERFSKGVEFFNNGEYAAALAEFHWAYEVSPHYMVLYNIGRCYSKLGKHIEAISYFEKYLSEGGDKLPKSRIEEVQAELKSLKQIIALLDITVNVKDAIISIDGKEVGTFPLKEMVKVEPGPHTISATAEGYKSSSKDIVVASGATTKINFELIQVVKWAKLKVESDAPGSIVVIDGKEVGKSPWEGSVKAGKHSVEIKAKGYKMEAKEIVLEADEERLLTFHPQIAGKPSRLILKSNVQGAEVFIEGKRSGAIPIKPLDFPAGIVRVKVMAPGYITWEGDIELAEGKALTADVKLTRDKKRISQAWFWTTFSLGLASAISAGITGYLALQKQNDYDSMLKGFENGTIANNSVNRKKADDLSQEGKTLVLTTDILWISTGTFALTSLILAFFTRFKPPESKIKLSFQSGGFGGSIITQF